MAPLDPGSLTCCMNLRWGSRTHCPGDKRVTPAWYSFKRITTFLIKSYHIH